MALANYAGMAKVISGTSAAGKLEHQVTIEPDQIAL
jgi:hypothetical protein